MNIRRLALAAAIPVASFGILFTPSTAHATDAGYVQITPTCEIPSSQEFQAQYVIDNYSQPTEDGMLALVCEDFGGVATNPTSPSLEYPASNGTGNLPPCLDPPYCPA